LTAFAFWYFSITTVVAIVIAWIAWTQAIGAAWTPSPKGVVNRMLEFAQLTDQDVLYDLGSGDGRIVVRAAKEFGVRAVGVEVDPLRIAISRLRARVSGVGSLVRIVSGNVFETSLADATVVTIFLTQKSNQRLMPRLQALKGGTRVVTHIWTFEGWQPTLKDEKLKVYQYIVQSPSGQP
jgi:precorrin-6B methylase 2